jgi:hypothetical protein
LRQRWGFGGDWLTQIRMSVFFSVSVESLLVFHKEFGNAANINLAYSHTEEELIHSYFLTVSCSHFSSHVDISVLHTTNSMFSYVYIILLYKLMT